MQEKRTCSKFNSLRNMSAHIDLKITAIYSECYNYLMDIMQHPNLNELTNCLMIQQIGEQNNISVYFFKYIKIVIVQYNKALKRNTPIKLPLFSEIQPAK